MDYLAPPSSSSDGSGGGVGGSSDDSSRCTTHARNQGGLSFWVSEGWRHVRPFLPFVLISCLVVALVYLLQSIVYGGPFTDPNFFTKFEKRWPRPAPYQAAGHHEHASSTQPTGDGTGGLM